MRLPREIGPIHFVGIGGIGMSGIAEVLCNLGYTIQGSDASEGANVNRLRDKGIKVSVGHAAENVARPLRHVGQAVDKSVDHLFVERPVPLRQKHCCPGDGVDQRARIVGRVSHRARERFDLADLAWNAQSSEALG